MKTKIAFTLFAATEIAIGTITLLAVLLSLLQGKSAKPPQVLIFVLVTATLSALLGIGILRKNLASYHLLIYFSSIIIFSKILVFGRIISLSGALDTALPPPVKNLASIAYHGLLIFYFTRKSSREYFGEKRNVFFSINLPLRR